jgi:hypothetical protein
MYRIPQTCAVQLLNPLRKAIFVELVAVLFATSFYSFLCGRAQKQLEEFKAITAQVEEVKIHKDTTLLGQ